MIYRLRLRKSLSYSGVVEATKAKPDVETDDKSTADAAVASGYFELIEVVEDDNEETPDNNNESEKDESEAFKEQLEVMNVQGLKKMATDMGIDVKGFKNKGDYISAIIKDVNSELADDEATDDEGSPTMIELQGE